MDRINANGRMFQSTTGMFSDLTTGHSVHLLVDRVPSFQMVDQQVRAVATSHPTLVDNSGKTVYMKSMGSSVNRSWAVKRQNESGINQEASYPDIQPVKYSRPSDVNLEVHRRLLDRTRVLPCRDIDSEILRPVSDSYGATRDTSLKNVGRENLRPFSGSYDIELSIHHQKSAKDSDVSVINKRSYGRVHERHDDINRRPLSVWADVNSVKLGLDNQSAVFKGLYDNEHLSIPAITRNEKELKELTDLQKAHKVFTSGRAIDPSALNNGSDRRKMSRIDRLSLRQQDGMNALRQRIEAQRQRKMNLSLKDDSCDNSDLEQNVGVHPPNLILARTSQAGEDRTASRLLQVENDNSDIDVTFSVTDNLVKPAPLISRVQHQSSDPVVMNADKFTYSIDDSVSQNPLPRKIASGPAAAGGFVKLSVDKPATKQMLLDAPSSIPLHHGLTEKPESNGKTIAHHLSKRPPLVKSVNSGGQQHEVIQIQHGQQGGKVPKARSGSDERQETKHYQVSSLAQRKSLTDITPSSWRTGVEVVRRCLGPVKRSQQHVEFGEARVSNEERTSYDNASSAMTDHIIHSRMIDDSSIDNVDSGSSRTQSNRAVTAIQPESGNKHEVASLSPSRVRLLDNQKSKVVISAAVKQSATERKIESKSSTAVDGDLMHNLKSVDSGQRESQRSPIEACTVNHHQGVKVDTSSSLDGKIISLNNEVPLNTDGLSKVATMLSQAEEEQHTPDCHDRPDKRVDCMSEGMLGEPKLDSNNVRNLGQTSSSHNQPSDRKSADTKCRRSYNVTEVQDYMRKQRKMRQAKQDKPSKPLRSERRSAPLDTNLHQLKNHKVKARSNGDHCTVSTSSQNTENRSDHDSPIDAKGTQCVIGMKTSRSTYDSKYTDESKSEPSSVVCPFGKLSSDPLQPTVVSSLSQGADASSQPHASASSYFKIRTVAPVVTPSSGDTTLSQIQASKGPGIVSYTAKAAKLAKLQFAANSLMSRLDAPTKQLEHVKRDVSAQLSTSNNLSNWPISTVGKLLGTTQVSHHQTINQAAHKDVVNNTLESPDTSSFEHSRHIDYIYHQHSATASSAFAFQELTLRQLSSLGAAAGKRQPIVAVDHSYLNCSDLDVSNDEFSSRRQPPGSAASDKIVRYRGADDVYPVGRQQDFSSSADTSRSQSPVIGEQQPLPTLSPSRELIVHKLNVKLDEKFLTARQQELHRRRINAEKALAWKQRLDQEEKEIEKLEAQVATFSATLSVDINESAILSETMMSDQSDCENRIHALQQELLRRKTEIERLKREQSKKRLQAKEVRLSKELEMLNASKQLSTDDENSVLSSRSSVVVAHENSILSSHSSAALPNVILGHRMSSHGLLDNDSIQRTSEQSHSLLMRDSQVVRDSVSKSDSFSARKSSPIRVTSGIEKPSPLPSSTKSKKDTSGGIEAAFSNSGRILHKTKSVLVESGTEKLTLVTTQHNKKGETSSVGENEHLFNEVDARDELKVDIKNVVSQGSMFNDSSDDTTWPSADICSEAPVLNLKETEAILDANLGEQIKSAGEQIKSASDYFVPGEFTPANPCEVVEQLTHDVSLDPPFECHSGIVSNVVRNVDDQFKQGLKTSHLKTGAIQTETSVESDRSSSSTLSGHLDADSKASSQSTLSVKISQHDSRKLQPLVSDPGDVALAKSEPSFRDEDTASLSNGYNRKLSSSSKTHSVDGSLSKPPIFQQADDNMALRNTNELEQLRKSDEVCETDEDIAEELIVEVSQADSVSDVRLEFSLTSPGIPHDNPVHRSALYNRDLEVPPTQDAVDDKSTIGGVVNHHPMRELYNIEFPVHHDDSQRPAAVIQESGQNTDSESTTVNASADELDKLISIAAAAVELFAGQNVAPFGGAVSGSTASSSFETGVSIVDGSVNKTATSDSLIKSRTNNLLENNGIVEGAMRDLLKDAISEMLTIRNHKRIDGGTKDQFRALSISPTKLADSAKSSVSDVSDVQGDEMPSSGGEEWIDDDFGLRPPPPKYSDIVTEKITSREPVAISPEGRSKVPAAKTLPPLQVGPVVARLTELPQTPQLIQLLVDKIVDDFWACRRYGEEWDRSRPPADYYLDSDRGLSVADTTGQRVYKKLVFDLVAETLDELYVNEDNDESTCHDHFQYDSDLCEIRPTARQRQNRNPPTTVDVLKPLVASRIIQQLLPNHDARKPSTSRSMMKCGASRRKQDNVDILLIRELRDEEPSWIDYTPEEFIVKMQLTDSLCELLLEETVQILRRTNERRSNAISV